MDISRRSIFGLAAATTAAAALAPRATAATTTELPRFGAQARRRPADVQRKPLWPVAGRHRRHGRNGVQGLLLRRRYRAGADGDDRPPLWRDAGPGRARQWLVGGAGGDGHGLGPEGPYPRPRPDVRFRAEAGRAAGGEGGARAAGRRHGHRSRHAAQRDGEGHGARPCLQPQQPDGDADRPGGACAISSSRRPRAPPCWSTRPTTS